MYLLEDIDRTEDLIRVTNHRTKQRSKANKHLRIQLLTQIYNKMQGLLEINQNIYGTANMHGGIVGYHQATSQNLEQWNTMCCSGYTSICMVELSAMTLIRLPLKVWNNGTLCVALAVRQNMHGGNVCYHQATSRNLDQWNALCCSGYMSLVNTLIYATFDYETKMTVKTGCRKLRLVMVLT